MGNPYRFKGGSVPVTCVTVKNREGFLVDSCTGEVLDFDNYDTTDFSKLNERPRVTGGEVNLGKVVLNYLLSVMSDEEKDQFHRILNRLKERRDPALYLAVYEYILEKEGKVVTREYVKFLRVKGLGRYAIRQKKKLLRRAVNEDPVLKSIQGDEEAIRIYTLLKKYGVVYGRAETRKKILMKYMRDQELKRKLLEKEKAGDTVLFLTIRDLEGALRFI